jgi:hypothetical protein
MRTSTEDPRREVERPDDERGSHNRLGYLNVDGDRATPAVAAYAIPIGQRIGIGSRCPLRGVC